MKTYWDHTPRERAEMTEDTVRGLLDAHLMEEGVLKVAPPVLKVLKQVPDIKKVMAYVVCTKGQYGSEENLIAFETAEKAHAFIDGRPMIVKCDWASGRDRLFTEPVIEAFVAKKEFYDRAELMNIQGLLKENESAQSENNKAEQAFRDASKTMVSCLNEVWEDWSDQRSLDGKHRRLVQTFEEYKVTAQGDDDTAAKFLLKVFTVDQVREANEWLGLNIPTAFAAAEAVN